MKINGIILERDGYPNITWDHADIFVSWNFEDSKNTNSIIGEVEVRKDEENKCYVGDMTLYDEGDFIYKRRQIKVASESAKVVVKILQNNGKLYPAIGCSHVIRDESGKVISCKLTEVSIVFANIDPNIPPLKIK